NEKKKICYARVSSDKQKEDLDRQCEHLREKYPDHELIKDIGSGLNWKRKGFTSILERSFHDEVVVARKDRLCRFAYELVEWIFGKNDTKILVLGSDVNVDDTESGELAEDLLSIVTIFTARHNGLRSAQNRKRRRETKNSKDTNVPNIGRKRKIKKMDGNCEVDLQQTNEELSWVKETPREVRSYVIRQLISAFKTSKKLHGNNFRMKYKTKKDRSQTISILARDWNRKKGKYAFLKTVIVSERPPEINHTVNITMNRLGHFYMCVSIPLDVSDNQDGVKGKVISLDPGVRTFMTGYDPNGRIVEWGNGDLNKIFRLSKRYDKLQKDKDLAIGRKNKRKRYKLKIKMYRIIVRIRNLINECHHQLARWLCENYEIILIPKFETSNMVLKNKRKIRSKTARMMLTWSHYRFRMFLHHKAREFVSCKVIECTEEYTSKTC
ncbi:1168_t:CDS:2, partial [Dentiscutata heterogama]